MRSERVRQDLARLAALIGICGFAITQPVLNVFGDAPEQFVFRGASATEILLFPFVVAIVPAVVLWLPSVVAERISQGAGRVAHLIAVAVALFLGLLQVSHHLLGTTGLTKAAVAAIGAGAGVWLYWRFEAARVWSHVMAFLSLLFVGLFLFSSPTGELAFAEPPDVVELDGGARPDEGTEPSGASDATKQYPDIVMVMLDELPTALLLDETGQIDPVRYPALAELAVDATWYRSYTTVSAETIQSVPSILSGQLPDESTDAVWTSQPDTLFRLLGGTYDLTASESLTRLCPRQWCDSQEDSSNAPPADPESATPAPQPPEPDRGGLARLLDDALGVWTDQIALERDAQPVLTGFEESAVEAAAPIEEPPTTKLDTPTLPQGSARGFAFPDDDRATELPRVDAFRSAIQPSDDPSLYYLHLMLPHAPYVFTESGKTYDGPQIGQGTAAAWDRNVVAQQLALQMQFTDRLVGDILDDARDAGVYDDAIVIVTADHAAGLDDEKVSRYYDGTNAAELMVTPLFIKAPNQSAGVVSDAPIEGVDILPTLADMLDIEVPWPVDGTSILDEDPRYVDPGCEDVRRFMRFDIYLVGGEPGDADLFELCANDIVPDGLDPIVGELRPGDEWDTAPLARLTPFDHLLGRPWDELDAGPSETVVELDRSSDIFDGSSPPLGVIRGSLEEPISAEWVAVAIGDRIAGFSRIYDTESFLLDPDLAADLNAENQFTVIVPSELLSEDGYDVRIASLETVDGELIASELSIDR
ncbi:MAG: sulfatase-like hydrolase/transferase [Acidimicrobiales bacterium]